MEVVLLYTPCKDAEQAENLAAAMLEAGLIACANVIPGHVSLYQWQGRLQRDSEVYLLCKTAPERAAMAAGRLEALHSYDCPCILQVSAQANPEFANWVRQQTLPENDAAG